MNAAAKAASTILSLTRAHLKGFKQALTNTLVSV